MPKFFRRLALWIAILMALPLQGYALYAASECPMAAAHAAGAPLDDCGGCDSGSACALMSFCHALQAGISADFKQWSTPRTAEYLTTAYVSAVQSRMLAPPVPPPRHV